MGIEYKAVKLGYTSNGGGFLGGKRSVNLSEVNELTEEGWEVHTFSFDEDGCWQEAIMVKADD